MYPTQHKQYILKTCGSMHLKNDRETGGSDATIQTPVQPFLASALKKPSSLGPKTILIKRASVG